MADVPTWRLFRCLLRPIVVSTICSLSSSLAAHRWVARFGEPAFEGSAHPLERSLFLFSAMSEVARFLDIHTGCHPCESRDPTRSPFQRIDGSQLSLG